MLVSPPGGKPETPASAEPKRLLLVSYAPLAKAGGASARWRSFAEHLTRLGWRIEVISAARGTGADPGARTGGGERRRIRARSAVMSFGRRLTAPLWRALGLRPHPLSVLWAPRGALAVRRRLAGRRFDLVVGTGPQMSALVAARLGSRNTRVPLVVEFRDLWAGNEAYDAGGPVLPAIERWLCRGASSVIVTTQEAARAMRSRLSASAPPISEIGNGYERKLLTFPAKPAGGTRPIRIIHSGALVPARPLSPLLDILACRPYRSDFELILQGYISQEARRELAAAGLEMVQVYGPAGWDDAIERIATADIGLVLQSRAGGDETAVAAKVFEYMALRRPVLCISSGGGTERLLRELGADRYCARLERPETIRDALDRLRKGPSAPVPPADIADYARDRLARRLDGVLRGSLARGGSEG